jgi:hypothetical protein
MLKTPPPTIVLAALTLVASAVPVASPGVFAASDHPADTGLQALDSRDDPAATPGYILAAPDASGRQDLDPGAATRSPGVDGDLGADSGALPLAQFARRDIKPAPPHPVTGFRALVARVRDGGLPEPASWALMLIGFGMIGGALRGFVVANRRLAGLQPEDAD